MFRKIDFSGDPHRQKHFDFFRSMGQAHFNVTAPVDIRPFLNKIKRKNLSFTPVMVYTLAKVANEIPAFQQRIRGEEAIEHDLVHPSFSIRTKASSVFSFCYVDFQEDFRAFYQDTLEAMERAQSNPSFEDAPGRDDLLFFSTLPWIPFTGLQHAMHTETADCIPRITWGKYEDEGGKTKIPLSVQAHHSLVDGIHMGLFFEKFAHYAQNPNFI